MPPDQKLEETPAFKKDPLTSDGEIAAVINMVLTVPENDEYPDVLIAPQERGERIILLTALNDFDPGNQLLLIPGNRDTVDFSGGYDVMQLRENYGLYLRDVERVICQGHTTSVAGQTDWVAAMIHDNPRFLGYENLGSAYIYSSQWHLPRVYLNMLKSLIKLDLHSRIKLFPQVVNVPWFEEIPGGEGAKPVDWLSEEIKSIKKYQEKGEVATLKELTEYFLWLVQ